jgi:hypothetical protein
VAGSAKTILDKCLKHDDKTTVLRSVHESISKHFVHASRQAAKSTTHKHRHMCARALKGLQISDLQDRAKKMRRKVDVESL